MKITSSALCFFTTLLFSSQPRKVRGFVPASVNRNTKSVLQRHDRVSRPSNTIYINGAQKLNDLRLNMAVGSQDDKESKGPVLNVGLVGQLALNQAIIGSTIWTGGPGSQALQEYAHFGEGGLLLGLIGAAALIGVSKIVETSESPVFAGINLSTEMVVLRLFGSNKETDVAFAVAAFLAGITGIVEETTFRGQLLPTLSEWSSNNLGLSGDTSLLAGAALSTFIFAALHTNPTSFFKGGEAASDNLVLLVFQLTTGSIFAFLFLATQNLAVPIIAHACYDFYTFFNTHLFVTGQMEYAKSAAVNMPSASIKDEKKWIAERGETFVQEARQTFYLMDTNRDGVLSRKELRIALFSYGINLSKMDSEMIASIVDLDNDGTISFGEFLEFVGPTGSTGKAVKNAFLGPV